MPLASLPRLGNLKFKGLSIFMPSYAFIAPTLPRRRPLLHLPGPTGSRKTLTLQFLCRPGPVGPRPVFETDGRGASHPGVVHHSSHCAYSYNKTRLNSSLYIGCAKRKNNAYCYIKQSCKHPLNQEPSEFRAPGTLSHILSPANQCQPTRAGLLAPVDMPPEATVQDPKVQNIGRHRGLLAKVGDEVNFFSGQA